MDQEQKSNGALIGAIIIIIILIIGGIYIWQTKAKEMEKQKLEQKQTQAQIESENLQASNDLNSLEQDVNSVDTNTGVDVESIQ